MSLACATIATEYQQPESIREKTFRTHVHNNLNQVMIQKTV